MELVIATIGAIIGAAASFFFTEYSKGKDERLKLVSAVRTELEMNLEIAREILHTNEQINFDSNDNQAWEWCEIIPFSESAWSAVISTGQLVNFKVPMISPLSRAFAMVKRANFAAEKISSGKYHPREGKEYTQRVRMAMDSTQKALDVLNASK